MSASKRAIFLDRDGVLNHLVHRDGFLVSPRSVADFRIYDDAADATRTARSLGFLVLVATNQPDVARGQLSAEELDRMHAQLRDAVTVDEIAVCPHDDAAHCDCRKPEPGMLLDIAGRWDVDLAASYMIGDSWRDMEAGRRAGCHTILVERDRTSEATSDARVRSLSEAVHYIESRA